MRNLIPVAFFAVMSTGCIVYDSDYDPDPYNPPVDYNYAPEIIDAEAGVFWDNYYYDDIWYFEADVDDFDGPYDVVAVWADVYDEYYGAEYIESFELFPTNDPYIWYSDWLGSSTWLDPFYDGYTVDFVAYDAYDEMDVFTVWAYTY